MFRGIEDDPFQQRKDRSGRNGGGPTGHSTSRRQYYEQPSQQLDRTKNMFEQNMTRAMDAAFDHMHNGMGSMAWDGHRKEHGETYYMEESFEVRAWSGGSGPMGHSSRQRDARDVYEDVLDERMSQRQQNGRQEGRSRYNDHDRHINYREPPPSDIVLPKGSKGKKQKAIMPPPNELQLERAVSRAGSMSSRLDQPTRVEMPPSPPGSIAGNRTRHVPTRRQVMPNLDEYDGLNDRKVVRSSHRSRNDPRYYEYSESEEDEDPRYYNPEYQLTRWPQHSNRVRRMESHPERRLDLYGYPPY